ncbi:MAG TPA: YvrJ family protein [Paenibacillaceae bacterium]|nr:YvrJ family protein [Paenibacillaceae bacterium]
MEDWVTLVSNVGFPVAVTAYLLVRIEGKLEQLAGSISDLNRSIQEFK